MKKEYNFNEEENAYEFCAGKECDLQEQLKQGDAAHHLCSDCIEGYEGTKPELSELSSTIKIRKSRK